MNKVVEFLAGFGVWFGLGFIVSIMAISCYDRMRSHQTETDSEKRANMMAFVRASLVGGLVVACAWTAIKYLAI